MNNLDKLVYQGFGSNSWGVVAYAVSGNTVYFSGLTPGYLSTSTINAAENVVLAICNKLGKRWDELRFVDIQTHLGYVKKTGEFCADELVIAPGQAGRPVVTAWKPVASSAPEGEVRLGSAVSDLPGLPNRIMYMFRSLVS